MFSISVSGAYVSCFSCFFLWRDKHRIFYEAFFFHVASCPKKTINIYMACTPPPPQLGGGGGQGGLKMLEKSLLGVESDIFIFVGEVMLLRGG